MREIPNSEGLELSGGEIGALILNHFTDLPGFLLPWAHALHEAGLTVILPGLPANATPIQKGLSRVQWRDWSECAESEFRRLKSRCERVFLAGFGIGGALALHLAEIFGAEIDGVILLEPSLPMHHIPRKVFPKLWRAAELDLDLYLVDQPILLMYSTHDRVLNSDTSLTIANEISSPFIREVVLERSFHIASADHDTALVVEESLAFINEVASGVWLTDIDIKDGVDDDADLIDAEFQSMIAGLSLDESSPTTYLDGLDRAQPDGHFEIPNPKLLPISDRSKRNALLAMVLGPLYTIAAAVTGFNPLGVEPWPGVLAFFGGLAVFLYRLNDGQNDDDGAIV